MNNVYFFDDILIATEAWDHHMNSIQGILRKLRHYGLTAG